MKTVEQICSELEVAFANRPYPGDDFIADTAEGDPSYEGNDAAEFFKGMDWKDFSWSEDWAYPDFFAFLTPKGLAYYMPGFLKASLLDFDQAFEVTQTVCFALTPIETWEQPELVKMRSDDLLQHQKNKLDEFSQQERIAIVGALHYLDHEYKRRKLITAVPYEELALYWDILDYE